MVDIKTKLLIRVSTHKIEINTIKNYFPKGVYCPSVNDLQNLVSLITKCSNQQFLIRLKFFRCCLQVIQV